MKKSKQDKQKEHELLRSIQKDKKNFSKLYEEYFQLVHNYLRKRMHNKSLSEDLASEVFEKAYRAIGDFRWQGISLSAWIFRIARNLLTDYYRKSTKRKRTISLTEIEEMFEDTSVSLYADYARGEEERVLYDALREFKELDQHLIYYKFFEDLSNKEIAKITGLAESNVGTRLYRIRRKIKTIMKQKGFDFY